MNLKVNEVGFFHSWGGEGGGFVFFIPGVCVCVHVCSYNGGA